VAIEWRWIPGFEGRYKVSSDGTVVSEPRYYARGGTLKPRRTRYNPATGEVPYLVVRLYPGDGTFADKMVHVAVLEAFSGPRPPGREGRHLDGDSFNNKRGNLIWGTHRENMQDKLLHGTDAQVLKTHCPQGHEYTPGNTYVGRSASGGKSRTCRRCRADREQRRRDRLKQR
jgi:hypothetical protein